MFKNMILYRIGDWDMSAEKLESALASKPFAECGSQDIGSVGFVSPCGDDRLVLDVGGHWLIALRAQTKVMPAGAVNEEVQRRVKDIENEQGYKPGRKQTKEIKEAVTMEMLPRAFTRSKVTQAWIDSKSGWLGVNASSYGGADAVLESLHDAFDTLPLRLIDTEVSPQSAMADWLASGDAPAGFTIDRDCELRAITDEKAAVRYVRHPLEGEEIPNHLAAGKVPTRLALTYDDRISFVLTERMEIKRLAFLDIIQEQAEKAAAEGTPQLEADFALMSHEMSRFIPALIDALGGERKAK